MSILAGIAIGAAVAALCVIGFVIYAFWQWMANGSH